ncbi:MAG: hypothetical protein QOE92_1014 [Chloroflexota bacterium]|jgi:hypothetical protein|nr:hypothetical protein [Chloroflexota bacterium]
MPSDERAAPPATRLLLRVGLVVFTVTVGIGIFNGFHFIELSRAVLLTHVHSGTLGWITLSAFAAAFWLFDPGVRDGDRAPRMMAIAFAFWVVCYVVAFLSGNFLARAIFGVPVLGMILAIAVRLIGWGRKAGMTTPRLGIILALIVLVIGSTIGVLVQIQLAASSVFLPDGAISGHAAAQVAGYLILFALSLIDWRLAGTARLGVGGAIQVVMLAVAGVLVALGAMLDIQPLLGAFIPLLIIATIIFLVRVGNRVVGAAWLTAGSSRFYAIAVPWLIVDVVLTILAIRVIITEGPAAAPFTLFTAADHAIFLGVMTNCIFGMIVDVTADRARFWPWADHVVFWGMNLALAGFVTTLVMGAKDLEKLFTPVQGTAILLAIVVYSIRLAGGGAAAPSAAAPAASEGSAA